MLDSAGKSLVYHGLALLILSESALGQLTHCPDPAGGCASSCAEVLLFPAEGASVSFGDACAWAYADQIYMIIWPCNDELFFNAWGCGELNCGSATQSANVEAHDCSLGDPLIFSSTEATAVAGPWGYNFPTDPVVVHLWSNTCSGWASGCSESRYGFGAAIATAKAWLDVSYTGMVDWVGQVQIRIGDPATVPNKMQRRGYVFRHTAPGNIVTSTVVQRFQAPQGTSVAGLTYNSGTGEWDATLSPTGGNGQHALELMFVDVNDDQLDANSDGRFNQADVTAAGSLPSYDSRFDFNRDSVIDSTDTDLMQEFVDAGFGAGMLGDANNDGSITCADWTALSSATNGATLGQTAYKIQVDQDLDGLISNSEYLAQWYASGRADWDFDHTFAPADISAFTNVWIVEVSGTGTTTDFDGNGFVQPADIAAFTNA